MKPLQNYIEEEMEKIRKELLFPYTRPPMVSKEGNEIMTIYQGIDVKRIEKIISQSLHRIAKITAEDLKQLVIEDVPHQYQERLLAKIKEFGI